MKQYFLQEEKRIQEENQRKQEALFEQARSNFNMNIHISVTFSLETAAIRIRNSASETSSEKQGQRVRIP